MNLLLRCCCWRRRRENCSSLFGLSLMICLMNILMSMMSNYVGDVDYVAEKLFGELDDSSCWKPLVLMSLLWWACCRCCRWTAPRCCRWTLCWFCWSTAVTSMKSTHMLDFCIVEFCIVELLLRLVHLVAASLCCLLSMRLVAVYHLTDNTPFDGTLSEQRKDKMWSADSVRSMMMKPWKSLADVDHLLMLSSSSLDLVCAIS